MNMDGMLLLPKGCTLTDRHIGILEAWGVLDIEVEVSENETDPDPVTQLPPEVLAALHSELEGLFFQPDKSDPGFKTVFQAILRRRVLREHLK